MRPIGDILEPRKAQAEDIISLFTHHREVRDKETGSVKTQIVTGISDSRMAGSEFMSEMAMRIVIRDIEKGFQHNLSLNKILKKITVLDSWVQSPSYSVKGEEAPAELLSWKSIKIEID